VRTLDACELTRSHSGEELTDRGATVAACTEGFGTTIGLGLAVWPGRRDGDRLAERFPCADACASITEGVQAVNRYRVT
jgi:hypothetical protein